MVAEQLEVAQVAGSALLCWRGAGERGMATACPDPLYPVPQVA